MDTFTEIYPTPIPRPANLVEIYDQPIYYVEFYDYQRYKVYRKHFIISKDVYLREKDMNDKYFILTSPEVHPYELLSGDCTPDGSISLTSKPYLKYLVDALNEKEIRERIQYV